MTMNKTIALLGSLGMLAFAAAAHADPFDDLEGEQEAAEAAPAAEEGTSFDTGLFGRVTSGGIGGAFVTATPTPKPHSDMWQEFEDASGTDAYKRYMQSDEVKMRKEMRKPLRKNSVEPSLDELESAVKRLKTSGETEDKSQE